MGWLWSCVCGCVGLMSPLGGTARSNWPGVENIDAQRMISVEYFVEGRKEIRSEK